MRRAGFDVFVTLGALSLGVIAYLRGQALLGVCFVGIGLLRGLMLMRGKRFSPKPEEEIRLDILSPSSTRYPMLPSRLRPQLESIVPSRDGDLKYYPCRAILTNGITLDCVYLVFEVPYLKHWGSYPGEDSGTSETLLADIASLTESPARLPPDFANQIYRAKESPSGDLLFTLVFSDGSRQSYQTGNAVDFIDYPPGQSAQDVTGVLPNEASGERRGSPPYSWCLFSE